MAKQLLAHRCDGYTGPKTAVFASKAGTALRPENVYRRVLAPTAIGAGFEVRRREADAFDHFLSHVPPRLREPAL